jgi:hypothetical protein
MTESLGRGLCGSLNARVERDIRDLARENLTLRRARYSSGRRALRAAVVRRSVAQFLFLYAVVLIVALLAEWVVGHYLHCWIPKYSESFDSGFVKDLASYLIAGQIGILAIVSVAVAVVTLLSERNDGASVNTDIRLYYVESYSYELALSGVALLLVLTVQLFWPLHHIVVAIGWGAADDWSKLALSVVHTLWFCVNLLLFHQFITTTLRFVEPNTREALRERYSANEVIPRDAKKRLLRFYYWRAPEHMFGSAPLKEGPGIAFGYGSTFDDRATAEITITFRVPSRLADVRLRPLQWALARWQKRVRKRPQGPRQYGQSLWPDSLNVLANFDRVLDGQCDLVLRRGEVPLSGVEKWVIRRCFRFAAASANADDMPSPANFLEQLVDKVIGQIEQTAETGFRAALDELVRYHCFILAAQNTKDDAGNTINLAELGGFYSRPDEDWVRQYRRAFAAAVDRTGNDTFFIDRLSNLTSRLIPDDGLNFSQRVLMTLLELGIHEVVALEDWVTRRAVIGATVVPGTSPALAGSDKRAYEDVLRGFVGGWETLAQTLISSLALPRRPSTSAEPAQWGASCKGFPVFQRHLHFAAYFFAAAVWNNDALGADRLRDLLLRWLQPFYANLQSSYMFGQTLLITPDLTTRDWATVQAEVAGRMRLRQDAALPGPVFGLLLWELHCDVVCVSGLVALHWYASGQQPSNTAAEAAVLTLRREKRAGDGSDLTATTPKSVFRLLFDFLIRYALNPRFAEDRYSANIDGLVRLLTNLASPRMVSGRIYGGYGIEGVETLRTVLLAALAANLPIQGDEGAARLLDDLKLDPVFAADESVRTFVWTMEQMVQSLDQAQGTEIYERASAAFSRDLDLSAATARLRSELASAAAAFKTLRTERARNAPLDESRMSLVRRVMSEAVRASGPTITCFRKYPIQQEFRGTIPVFEFEFGVMDRGAFTLPPISALSFEELPPIFTDILRHKLTDVVFGELYHRPKRLVAVDVTESTEFFWQRVIAEASTVGDEPMVLVPFASIGEEISTALYLSGGQTPSGVNVTREAAIPTGGGTNYLGTVKGILVYGTQGLSTQAILCSGQLLRSISYAVVHGLDDIADFTFVEGEDPEKSRVRLKVAQRLEWADHTFVEFDLRREDEG